MHKIVFLVPEVVVGCMEFGWVVSWIMGPKFSLCDGLCWVEGTGPTDNSDAWIASAFTLQLTA